MELTDSWRRELPASVVGRYDIVETRNAAAMLRASSPTLLTEVGAILDGFFFDVERIVRPGGSKHLISAELDEAFRVVGWREAKFRQRLVTELVVNPYRAAGEELPVTTTTENRYEGHQIDNVKGRVGLDVEWNPKDGNLDRDFANFRSLYDAGVLDLGILVVRREGGMRRLWIDTIARAKRLDGEEQTSESWSERLRKTPDDPLGTTTTSNFEKLERRVERGDGGGCPILAIAITTRAFRAPADLDDAIRRVARDHTAGRPVERLAHRLYPQADVGSLDEALFAADDEEELRR